jgi:hypothetical protein
MSVTRKETIKLMWLLHSDSFADANKKNFVGIPTPKKLGTSVSAVNTIVSSGEELRMLMPNILGLDPTSVTSNWDARVRQFWDSLSVDIYSNGKDLEIGFIFDILDNRRKEYINNLKLINKDITTDLKLANYVIGKTEGKPNVPDNEKWKYGHPIEPMDWLLYRFCEGIEGRGYKAVANRNSDISTITALDVRFYFYDELKAKEFKTAQHKTMKEALQKYLEIIAKEDTLDDLLIVFGNNITNLDSLDKDQMLKAIVDSRPEDFLKLAEDKNLTIKAKIEKYIAVGILHRINSTSIIVDGTDPSNLIGNTMEEAISYFSPENTSTTATVAQYSNMYNAKTQHNDKG